MAASTNLVHIVSTTRPVGMNLGDEWYNPTTNLLYKNLLVNGATTLVNQVLLPTLGNLILTAPSTGTNTTTFPIGTGTAAVQGLSTNIVSSTVQASTSGTAITFTSIPGWVKRVSIVLNGVSTSGTSVPLVRIGSESIANTGYSAGAEGFQGVGLIGLYSTVGVPMGGDNQSTFVLSGKVTFQNVSGNIWVASGAGGGVNSGANRNWFNGGTITLSGPLDRIQYTTTNGTDTFTAGSINVLYE